jgi:hypothetical protein
MDYWGMVLWMHRRGINFYREIIYYLHRVAENGFRVGNKNIVYGKHQKNS